MNILSKYILTLRIVNIEEYLEIILFIFDSIERYYLKLS